MGPTRPRALLIALLLGAVLVGHLGGCNLVRHHTPTLASFQADAGPLVAVSPVTLLLSGAWQFAVDRDAEGLTRGWAQPAFDDTGWLRVTVPHTWNVMPGYADYAGIPGIDGSSRYLRWPGKAMSACASARSSTWPRSGAMGST
jgi:hypothetical protein